MPKKTDTKTNSKAKSKKTTAAKTQTRSTTSKNFRAQQADFHKKHPSAQNLIGLFIVAFCILIVLYLLSGSKM